MTTHNQALDLLRRGKADEAYRLARMDEGWGGASKEKWIGWARVCIEKRDLEARATAQRFLLWND